MALNILLSSHTTKEHLIDLEKNVMLTTKIGKLVHETQKERGFTAAFMGSKGKKFQNELSTQKNNTDLKISELKLFLKSYVMVNNKE